MNNYLKLKGYDIVLFLFIFFIGGNLIGALLRALALLLHVDIYPLIPLITIITYILVYITYYYLCQQPKKEKFELNYSFQNFQVFPLLLIIFIAQFFMSEFLSGLIPTEGGILGKLYNTMTYSLLGNLEKYPIISFFSICILAPLLEEIFFRGFILKGMLNNKENPSKAILISALIFGGIHFYPWQAIGGFLAGIVLGYAFYKTGSLLICTLLHFLNNLVGFLLFLKLKKLELYTFGTNEWILFLIGIIIFISFGYLFLQKTKNYKWKSY